jgi:hypothetical protein
MKTSKPPRKRTQREPRTPLDLASLPLRHDPAEPDLSVLRETLPPGCFEFPNGAIGDRRIKSHHVVILMAAYFWSEGRARCWPTDEELWNCSTYRTPKYIRRCLDDLVAAGYLSIVVDDSVPTGRVIVIRERHERSAQ